jgi:hypothetical protein
MRARIKRSDDAGATLILVLIVITTMALVMGAVLSQTDTSIRTTLALRDQAGSAYNGDGAAQAAINNLRSGYGYSGTAAFGNTPNTSCFGPSSTQGTLPLQDFYPATNGQKVAAKSSASVVCTGETGTGAQAPPVQITGANRPGQAILTLPGPAGEDGINIKALAKDSGNVLVPFNVHGSIVSDSNINVVSGSLKASGAVTAHSGCSGTITSTPPPVCNASTTADPAYATELALAGSGVPPYQTVPTTCPGKLVTFNPGYYDDAAALSALMNGTGTCKGSVWWFKPGSYYFDFHNAENPIPSLAKTSGDVWLIKDGQLIAGTPCAARTFPDPINDPNNPQCTPIAQPTVPAVVPGACLYPTEAQGTIPTGTGGVQFIFGGDSQLQLAGTGDVEICGSYQTDRVAPSFFGLQSGTSMTTPQAGLKLTSVFDKGDYGNSATVANLVDPNDGKFASWKSNKNNQIGTLTVSGFAPTAIPAGSTFKSATVKVTHRHSDNTAVDNISAVLTPIVTPTGGLGAALPSATAPGHLGSAAFQTDGIPVDTTRTGSLAEAIHAGTFNGAQIAVAEGLTNNNDTEDIDSIRLDITYDPPAFRAETSTNIPGNCLAMVYTGVSGGPCAVLSTSTSYAGAFYMEGTTYTPIAPIDVTLSNVTQQVMRFGLISRTLFIKETGSLTYSGPVVFLPDITGIGIAGTIVDLNVYVCDGVSTSTCSSDPSRKLRLTVRVLIDDPGATPVAGKRRINVLSWSMQR